MADPFEPAPRTPWWRRRLNAIPWLRGLVPQDRSHEVVEEGLAIALAAAQLSLRNRIIVDTLARGQAFEADAVLPIARETLLALAAEQERAAALAQQLRRSAWSKVHGPLSTHDYGDRDLGNLSRRREHSQGVAAALREMAGDEPRLRELVERSRDAAWGDVSGNLVRRLREGHPERDSDYEQQRESRIRALLSEDLVQLQAEADRRDEPGTL